MPGVLLMVSQSVSLKQRRAALLLDELMILFISRAAGPLQPRNPACSGLPWERLCKDNDGHQLASMADKGSQKQQQVQSNSHHSLAEETESSEDVIGEEYRTYPVSLCTTDSQEHTHQYNGSSSLTPGNAYSAKLDAAHHPRCCWTTTTDKAQV
jgi:hypothetical protein